MSIPTRIAEALEDLEHEKEFILSALENARAAGDWDRAILAAKKRDQVCNVLNNLKALYCAD